MLLFLCEFAGDAAALCPRNVLARTLERAADMGYTAHAALEYEFFLFNETPHSVRQKNYQNLQIILKIQLGRKDQLLKFFRYLKKLRFIYL